jgi:hypothetical protein
VTGPSRWPGHIATSPKESTLTKAELRAALEARGLATPHYNPAVLMRLAHRPRRPGTPPSRYFRELLEQELERRRRNQLTSMDPAVKGGPRLVLLTEPQDEDPLIALMKAANIESMQQFRDDIKQARRRRDVAPAMARARQRALEVARARFRFQVAARDRGLL